MIVMPTIFSFFYNPRSSICVASTWAAIMAACRKRHGTRPSYVGSNMAAIGCISLTTSQRRLRNRYRCVLRKSQPDLVSVGR